MADIPGINIPAPVVPFTTADTYATHDAEYGKGGFRSVATYQDMLDIPPERRANYMRVKVYADSDVDRNLVYEWNGTAYVPANDGDVNFVIEW